MRKLTLMVAALSILALAMAGAALAQDAGLVGLRQPVAVTIRQAVPVSVTLTIPQIDGSALTSTVPLTVGIDLQVTLDGQGVTSVNARAGEPAKVAVKPTPDVSDEQTKAKTIWDLPHLGGILADPVDIGGFQVQPTISLFDFAQVKEWDADNQSFYGQKEMNRATILGFVQTIITNTSQQDLYLSARDSAVVVGTEQADLSDMQSIDGTFFNKTLLPGVTRWGVVPFVLKITKLSDLSNQTEARIQMRGPIKEDGYPLVDGAKYKATITLESLP